MPEGEPGVRGRRRIAAGIWRVESFGVDKELRCDSAQDDGIF